MRRATVSNDYLDDWNAWNRVAIKLYYDPKTQIAPREVDNLLSLLERLRVNVHPNIKILDIGAGWGRHSLQLTKRGFKRVFAVDASPVMRELFEEQIKQSPSVTLPNYIMADFLCWAEEQASDFDLLLVLWSMFGVCKDDDINREFLQQAFRLLRAGGRIVIETVLRDRLAKALNSLLYAKAVFTFDLSLSRVEHWELKRWRGIRFLILGSTELIEEGKVLKYTLRELPLRGHGRDRTKMLSGTITLRYYDLGELISMLSEVGFAVEFVGGPLSDPEDRQSSRATIIARRL
jgi:SAM-dependent methyltransferase